MRRFTIFALSLCLAVAAVVGPRSASAFPAARPTDLSSPHDDPSTPDVVELVEGATPFTGDTLTATYSGFEPNPAGTHYWAMLCNPKIAGGSYNASLDCVQLVAPQSVSMTGAGVIEGIVIGDGGRVPRTQNGDSDWECDAGGSAEGVVDPTDYGVGPTKLYDTCYVVIREGSLREGAFSKNQIFPVRFVDPNNPSAKRNAVADTAANDLGAKDSSNSGGLLAVGGIAVVVLVGLAFVYLRRRPRAVRRA